MRGQLSDARNKASSCNVRLMQCRDELDTLKNLGNSNVQDAMAALR